MQLTAIGTIKGELQSINIIGKCVSKRSERFDFGKRFSTMSLADLDDDGLRISIFLEGDAVETVGYLTVYWTYLLEGVDVVSVRTSKGKTLRITIKNSEKIKRVKVNACIWIL